MISILTQLFYLFVFPGFLFAIFLGMIYMGIDRKLFARMQNRIGPPIWQQFLDFFKLMSKESIKPGIASGIFTLAPAVSLAALLTLVFSFPILGEVIYPTLDNIMLIIYLLLLSAIFTAFAGFASSNPFGVIGSIRKITQLFAVEFPLLVAIFVAVIASGSYALGGIFSYQISNGYLALTYPLAAIAFLIAVQGELHKTPFDVPDAKQEIVAGLYTEFSGATLAIFELIHALKFFVLASLAIFLFFGGASSIWVFLAKFFIIGFLLTVIRTIFARIRIDQLFKFYWLLVGPLALIDLVRVVLL